MIAALLYRLPLITMLFVSGCQFSENTDDPFEVYNRNAYKFHLLAEDYVYLPLYGIYQDALPIEMRMGLSNMSDNINEIQNIVHDLLQGEIVFAISDTWRLLINTTLGLGGIFDVASRMNLPKHHQSIAATLSVWGAKPGPFIVIPGIGAGYLANHFSTYSHFQSYQSIKMSQDMRNTVNNIQNISFISANGDQTLMTNFASDRYAMVKNYMLQKYESYKHRPDYATLKQELVDENLMDREEEEFYEDDYDS